MKAHLIAIGGSVMHNLALALQENGYIVTGSDDQIFDPALTRLKNAQILPESLGWFPDKIHAGLDVVILGMHAHADNPELKRALELGLEVKSFPEFIAEQYHSKTKIVVAGSHGKTSTSAMIIHILQHSNKQFDYLVGALLEGFKTMVKISDAPIAVIEGDEYLSSCLDKRPKFLHYSADICIITGIAWDHYNVFNSYQTYVNQFGDLIKSLPSTSKVLYCKTDSDLCDLIAASRDDINYQAYDAFPYTIDAGVYHAQFEKLSVPLEIFGKHNMQNMHAAILACVQVGITVEQALYAMQSFTGANKRLQLLSKQQQSEIYLDFAHAPSKVKATVEAVREKFPTQHLIVINELHTYSSLNEAFLPQYKHSLDQSNIKIVYFDPEALKIKRLNPLSDETIINAFGNPDLNVAHSKEDLENLVNRHYTKDSVVLFMGSGHFGGLDLKSLASKLHS